MADHSNVPPHAPPPGESDNSENALFEQMWEPLRKFFRRAGCGVAECDDLAQDTLARAYRAIEGFRHEASEKTWVLKIAANVLRNHWREQGAQKRTAREIPLHDDEGVTGTAFGAPQWNPRVEDGPLQAVLDRETREQIDAALLELPPQMRRCLIMRLYQELKYEEIATVMRISIGAVKSQIHEARRRLRKRLRRHDLLGEE